jgi:hypothetical protein
MVGKVQGEYRKCEMNYSGGRDSRNASHTRRYRLSTAKAFSNSNAPCGVLSRNIAYELFLEKKTISVTASLSCVRKIEEIANVHVVDAKPSGLRSTNPYP